MIFRCPLFLLAFAAACSSPKAPLPTLPAEDAAAPVEPPAAHETPDAEAPPAPSATASTPPAPPAPADECTPIGVAFEKTVRPKMKDCYREGKKKDPNLEGTVKVMVAIDFKGRIKSIKITEKTLPEPVAQCMLKVVKGTPFPDAAKCPDKNITVPITFPTPP